MTPPKLLCEHAEGTLRGHRDVCRACGSFWDVESRAADVVYDERYPEQRGHFDPRVGALKVGTLKRWLGAAGIDLAGKHVCEVGFGGGSCIAYLERSAGRVTGLEANAFALERVRASGVTADLLVVDRLPGRLPVPVDLWLFQDSFEHIPEPAPFVDWLCASSAPAAEILLVAPRADSMSQRLLGRYWPHKLPDHCFHWSRRGLIEFMARRGFALRTEFSPLKLVSPAMIVAHCAHKAGRAHGRLRLRSGRLAVPFNFGEMGIVFRHTRG